jgi:hypothetical protein
LNDAFVVNASTAASGLAHIVSVNGREGEVEAELLRPVARGEDVAPWVPPRTDQSMVWTHDERGAALAKLPPHLARWLSPYRRALLARSDARSARRWWSLFRTEAARSDLVRVIWADIGRSPRATVLDAGDVTVPLNSCYVARCPGADDAFALATLLNSPLIAAWLSVVAEPARGGYRRYLGWTMSLLPIPAEWDDHRAALAGIARGARETGRTPSSAELIDAVVEAFGLRRRDIEPLLTWAAP